MTGYRVRLWAMSTRVGPLDESTCLADLVRVLAPHAGEPLGVWLQGSRRMRRIVVASHTHLVLTTHSDLGALLVRVPRVAVHCHDRIVALPARALALGRVLEFTTGSGAAPCSIRLNGCSPEQALAQRRAEGWRVLASRIVYQVSLPSGAAG